VKHALLVLWIACAAAFVLPDSAWTTAGRRLFVALVLVHAIECVVFLPRLRSAGGSLGQHLFQTLLFGILHVRSLPASRAA
jgi:uncharacterized protein YhhL (DUF1145 family)